LGPTKESQKKEKKAKTGKRRSSKRDHEDKGGKSYADEDGSFRD